jgi:hypothetical protein
VFFLRTREVVSKPEVNTLPSQGRKSLNREYVREILLALILEKQQMRSSKISDATQISQPEVLALLYVRLKFGEGAEIDEQTLDWKKNCTVGEVLDMLGLQNCAELERTKTRSRGTQKKAVDD